MSLRTYLQSLLCSLLHHHQSEHELDEEFLSHIARHADDLQRSGLPRPEAERQARIAFGSSEKVKEGVREQRPGFFLETIAADTRFALRMLRKNPAFTAVAILTLALGIGANTAIFSVLQAVLLRPLPYPKSDRLVVLSESSEEIPDMSIAMANFNDWRAQNTVFENTVAYQGADALWTGQNQPDRLRMRRISAGFSPTLRVQPILGRTLSPEDDKVGAPRVVLLSEGLWESRFARDPNVLGQQMILDGEPYSIIGVFPAHMHASLRRVDVFTSLWRLEDQLGGEKNRGNHPGIYAYARLRDGVTVQQAQSEMKSIASRLDELHPQSNGKDSVTVKPLLGAIVGDVRPSILVLVAAVALVLLIACANIANLQLARATERYRELAVRAALGASPSRLIRQMLTESILVSLFGGISGLLLAFWITALLAHSAITSVPRLDEVSIDRWVLAFTLGLSVLTGVFFGIFPALQASRTDVQKALKEGSRTSSSSSARHRTRDVLVAFEVCISLILLVGAGLLAKSLYEVTRADSGFDPAHVLTARFSLPDVDYHDDASRRNFVLSLTQKLQAIPGVETAGMRNPLLGNWQSSYVVAGKPLPPPGQYPSTDMSRVTPHAMQAMGMRLLRGRYFNDYDNENSLRVCIIDDTFVKQNFSEEDPLGKRISTEDPPEPGKERLWVTVVGVVSHVKNYGVDQPSRVETYVPEAQNPSGGGSLLVRTSGDPNAYAGAVRNAVHSIAPNVPLFEVRPLSSVVEENAAPRRFAVLLITSFAILALALSAVGIYGVLGYLVAQRTHEVGVRLALGARPRDVLGLVVGHGARLALVGALIGLVASLALTRLMSSLLFRVSATDPLTYTSGALLLMIVALAACYTPARRAARVDPAVALRSE
jgi:putative ABC transport system permease protein